MGNKNNTFGNATATAVEMDIPAGSFGNIGQAGAIINDSKIAHYQQFGTHFHVEYAGHGKFAAKVDRYTADPSDPYRTFNIYVSTTTIGVFDSRFERQAAVNAAVGTGSGVDVPIFADYFGDYQYRVYGAEYPYVNIWLLNTNTHSNTLTFAKPCYTDLVGGYVLDPRGLPQVGKVTPTTSKLLKLSYYRANPSESIPGLQSIDFYHYEIEIVKGKPIYLPIEHPVMGTLTIDDSDIESQIRAMSRPDTEYPLSVYFPNSIPDLFGHWEGLYAAEEAKALPVSAGSLISTSESHQTSATVKILGANNNVWNNGTVVDDVGMDLTHPMFAVNESLAFDRHFKPQTDGSYGDLIMNSPKLEDLWTHFCSQTPAANELDPTRPRLNTHGHLIQETANRIGYHPDSDGNIDVAVQKAQLQTKCADVRTPLDTENYSPYGFGKMGMAIANLPNDYNGSNPVNGGGSLVTNLPNLILELHGQINKSLGIQDGSNIVFTVGDKKVHYPNQVAMLIDLSRTVAIMSQLLSTVYTNSLQTESEVREIIGALGLGTTDDSVGLNINGQSVNVPYKGVDRRESLVNELADIKLTLAVIMGKLI
jgi:hypothetical protein